jgi:hypothetical protein
MLRLRNCVTVDAKTRDAIERAMRGLETMTVEECHEVAAVARESAKLFTSARKREICEESAVRFEQRAAAIEAREARR